MENKQTAAAPVIGGVYAAMITPFGKDGHLDETTARAMVDFYAEKGLDGVFAVSNVGEFAAMSMAEKMALTETACRTGQGRLNVCPGVTDFDYANTLALARHADECGAAAVVLSAPVYYPYTPQYVEAFITRFLDESPLPVIFYHSPKFAQPVSFSFLLEVLAHPRVAAVKESSGDAMLLLRLLEACRAEGITVPVMLGFEELFLTGLVHGAKGSITSCGGILPELMLGIARSHAAGDIATATAMQQSVCRITGAIKRYGFPLGYKMAMAARGFSMRIIKSGLEDLEATHQQDIPAMRQVIAAEYALHGLTM